MTVDAANDERGRVVVVTAGFALWRGGKCLAAARWGDIRRLRAYRPPGASDTPVRLGVDLADGTVLEFREDAPGFTPFLTRASETLSGLVPFAQWHPVALAAPADGVGATLFERPPARARRGR